MKYMIFTFKIAFNCMYNLRLFFISHVSDDVHRNNFRLIVRILFSILFANALTLSKTLHLVHRMNHIA